jgi:terminase small subunit / prophage DNA-packing protein
MTTTTTAMSKQSVSQWLGVSRQVIDRMVAEGLPTTEGDIGRQRFDPKSIARWLLAKAEAAGGGPAVDKQRERLLRAQADRAELELAKARGQLVEKAKMERGFETTWRTVRDLMRAIPRSAADRLLAEAPAGRVPFAAALLAEIDDALTRASNAPVERDDDDAPKGMADEDDN